VKTILALTITIVLWASAFVGIRVGVVSYNPGVFALLRYLIASVVMLILYLRVPNRVPFSWKLHGKVMLLGVLGFGVYNVTLNYGEVTVPAGIASFMLAQMPIVIILFAMKFYNERFKKLGWLGLAISLIGIIVIMIGESEHGQFDIGVVFLMVTVFSGSFYSVMLRPILNKMRPIELTTFAIWGGTFSMLPYLPKLLEQIPTAPFPATLWAVYLGVFPGAIAYALWSYAMANMPVSKVANYLYGMPILSTIMAYFLLGEFPAVLSLIGGLVALVGAIITNKNVYRTK